MNKIFLVIFLASLLTSCAYSSYPDDKKEWHADIFKGVKDKIYLRIVASEWVPIVNPEGIGGPRDVILNTIELTGSGPTYRVQSSLSKSSKHPDWEGTYEGVVIFDLKTKRALVELNRNAATGGAPSRSISFPYNGDFKITKGLELVGNK